MILTHLGFAPQIDASAYIAPTATICGNVWIGPHCRVMHGAVVVAEGGIVEIGSHGIVMENAVLRATDRHSCHIGDHCFIGAGAHVAGCMVEDGVFIATSAAVFYGACLGQGSEVRINGVVHVRTHLPPGQVVPIGWVAVGNPITLLSPERHEEIWQIQKQLDFPLTVYGIARNDANMVTITEYLSEVLGLHADDFCR